MNKYAQVALIAAERIENGMQPRAAWEQASCKIFPKGSASQTKGCPKNAFFGLYEPIRQRGPCLAQSSSRL